MHSRWYTGFNQCRFRAIKIGKKSGFMLTFFFLLSTHIQLLLDLIGRHGGLFCICRVIKNAYLLVLIHEAWVLQGVLRDLSRVSSGVQETSLKATQVHLMPYWNKVWLFSVLPYLFPRTCHCISYILIIFSDGCLSKE